MMSRMPAARTLLATLLVAACTRPPARTSTPAPVTTSTPTAKPHVVQPPITALDPKILCDVELIQPIPLPALRPGDDLRMWLVWELAALAIRRRLHVALQAIRGMDMRTEVRADLAGVATWHAQLCGTLPPERSLPIVVAELERLRRHGLSAPEFTEGQRIVDETYREILTPPRRSGRGVKATPHFLLKPLAPVVGRGVDPAPAVRTARAQLVDIPFSEVDRAVRTLSLARMSLYTRELDPGELRRLAERTGAVDPGLWADQGKLHVTPPAVGTIIAERVDGTQTEWTLGNGVRVVARTSDLASRRITIVGRSPGGSLALAPADIGPSWFLGIVGDRIGGGDYDETTLARALFWHSHDDLGFGLAPHEDVVSGAIDESGVETLLQVIYLKMAAPRRDDAAVAAELARLGPERDPPQLSYRLPPPLAVELGLLTARADVTAERLWNIHVDRFGTANGFTFTIDNVHDVPALRPLVARYLGALPTGRADPGVPVVRATRRITHRIDHHHPPPAHVHEMMWTGEATTAPRPLDDPTLVAAALSLIPDSYATAERIPSTPPGYRVHFTASSRSVDEATLRRFMARAADARLSAAEMAHVRDVLVDPHLDRSHEPRSYTESDVEALTVAAVAAAVRRLTPDRAIVELVESGVRHRAGHGDDFAECCGFAP